MHSAYIPHERVQSHPIGPSKTLQAGAGECDINQIMAKYQRSGILEHVNNHGSTYGDMPQQEDFHAAMSLVASANSMFAELPSSVRAEFSNDASEFLDFVADDENRERLIELGLVTPEPPSEDDTPSTPETPAPEPDKPAPAAPAAS